MLTKYSGLETSGRHKYTMIQIAGNSLPNDPPTGDTVRINSKSFPWDVRSVQGTYFPHFRQRPLSDIM